MTNEERAKQIDNGIKFNQISDHAGHIEEALNEAEKRGHAKGIQAEMERKTCCLCCHSNGCENGCSCEGLPYRTAAASGGSAKELKDGK